MIIPIAAIIGCVPLSFGVMFKCRILCDTILNGNQILYLLNKEDCIPIRCINVEKDYTISIFETSCSIDDIVSITVEYSEMLIHFPLKEAQIVIKTSGDEE